MQAAFLRGFLAKESRKNRTVADRRNGVQRMFLSLLFLGEIRACLYTDMTDPVKQENMVVPEREAGVMPLSMQEEVEFSTRRRD